MKEQLTERDGARRWPIPTVNAPDLDDLIVMADDGECIATDGCLIETDGVCEHGYPSWLLFWGFV
jgi:hypothetical protein